MYEYTHTPRLEENIVFCLFTFESVKLKSSDGMGKRDKSSQQNKKVRKRK